MQYSRRPHYDMHRRLEAACLRTGAFSMPAHSSSILRVGRGAVLACRCPRERATCCSVQHREEGKGGVCAARHMLKHAWTYPHGRPRARARVEAKTDAEKAGRVQQTTGSGKLPRHTDAGSFLHVARQTPVPARKCKHQAESCAIQLLDNGTHLLLRDSTSPLDTKH